MGAVLPGRFNDGHTAASRKVVVKPSSAGLDIRGEDGLLVAFWHVADLMVDGEQRGGKTLRLRCRADQDARLSVENSEWIRPLLPARPRFPWGKLGATVAATIVLGLALWQGIPAASRQLVALVPPAWEQRWGDALADGLEKNWGTCRQPASEAALHLLSDRIAAGLDPAQRPRRVVVVKQDDQNAIALPGGTVMVFSGLLKEAQDPGELAGVLAHEFTHLRLRHPTAGMIRAVGVGTAVMLLTGDSSGVLASGAAMAMAGAYSREDEAAADRGAVDLLTRAGMDSDGLSAFFRRLASEPNHMPEWLSTHPDTLARAEAVDALRTRTGAPALSPGQWTMLKRICG
ncbi:MAG: M48 family metallopeptidase [Bacteroidota bacterium]